MARFGENCDAIFGPRCLRCRVKLEPGGVKCMKCPKCGYSVTFGDDPPVPTDQERAANHKALMQIPPAERFKLMGKEP